MCIWGCAPVLGLKAGAIGDDRHRITRFAAEFPDGSLKFQVPGKSRGAPRHVSFWGSNGR